MNFFLPIKILFKAKWFLQKPKKKKILIFDSSGSDIIKKLIPANSYQVLPSRFKEINFYCLVKTIFSTNFFLRNTSKNYYNNFIKLSKTKIVISFIDHNNYLWNLKKDLPRIKVLLIQNGIRRFEEKNKTQLIKKNNPFGIIKKKKETGKVDFLFTANKHFSKKYKNFLECETKNIGFFRNNQFFYKSKKIDKNTLTYISQYRNDIKHEHNVSMPDEKILKFLNEYTFKYDKKLNILARPKGPLTKLSNEEELLNFCKKELQYKNWEIYPEMTKNQGRSHSNYIKGINSDVIVTIDSTLGYELLARNKRVAFFCIRDWGGHHLKFGYPKKLKDNGSFWSNNYDVKKYEIILDYLFLNSDKSFYGKNKKIINDISFLDKKNKIFKKTIKNLINGK